MATTSSQSGERPRSEEGHNLPIPLTSLVGRARELDRIAETLRRTRLVTVSGPGGVGKTRLALALARRQIAHPPDGVWLVDLTSGVEAPDVAAEAARVLSVQTPSGTTTTDVLRRYLTLAMDPERTPAAFVAGSVAAAPGSRSASPSCLPKANDIGSGVG